MSYYTYIKDVLSRWKDPGGRAYRLEYDPGFRVQVRGELGDAVGLQQDKTPGHIERLARLGVGVDVAVSPRRSAANYILAQVRSGQVTRVVQVEQGKAEILEVHVPSRARVLGRTLMYVDLPRGALIACIVRERSVFVPRGTDEVLSGDVVVVFTVPDVREEVLRLFRDPKEEGDRP